MELVQALFEGDAHLLRHAALDWQDPSSYPKRG